MEQGGRRYSGFNLFDPDDENLLCSIVRGEFNISGLRNKTLRLHLPELSGSQVSRLLKTTSNARTRQKIGHTCHADLKYVRVSTDKQAEQRGSQAEKMRAMALVHDAGLLDLIAGWWRVGQKLRSGPPGTRLLAMVDRRPVQAVITH